MVQSLQLSTRLTQSLVLAPQLQQSLALLQAPTLELKALVEQELQQNPVLEKWPPTETELQRPSRNARPMKWPKPPDPAEPAEDVRRSMPCRRKGGRSAGGRFSGGIRQARATRPGMARPFFADQHSHPPVRRGRGKAPVHVRFAGGGHLLRPDADGPGARDRFERGATRHRGTDHRQHRRLRLSQVHGGGNGG